MNIVEECWAKIAQSKRKNAHGSARGGRAGRIAPVVAPGATSSHSGKARQSTEFLSPAIALPRIRIRAGKEEGKSFAPRSHDKIGSPDSPEFFLPKLPRLHRYFYLRIRYSFHYVRRMRRAATNSRAYRPIVHHRVDTVWKQN